MAILLPPPLFNQAEASKERRQRESKRKQEMVETFRWILHVKAIVLVFYLKVAI
jgi:hypothetical protein